MTKTTKPTILIPGSYDIPTRGHEQMWRAFSAVGHVVVAIGKNSDKKSGALLPSTRAELCRRIIADAKIDATVVLYDGSLVDAVKETGASLVVRGVRGPSDLEEGVVIADHLTRCGSVPVTFFPSSAELRGCSSSLVRQLLGLSGMETEIRRLLPTAVHRVVNSTALSMRAEFESLCERSGLRMEGVPELYEDLMLRYGESNRYYHTLEHVQRVIEQINVLVLQTNTVTLFETKSMIFAAWFHDAMQGSHGDELRSSELAKQSLTKFGMSSAYAMTVARLIQATSHDKVQTDQVAACVVDADLSILATPEDVFDYYEAQIRAEWSHVPEVNFRTGRAAILERLLVRSSIYSLAWAKQEWEPRARTNLLRSIARLRSNTPLPVFQEVC